FAPLRRPAARRQAWTGRSRRHHDLSGTGPLRPDAQPALSAGALEDRLGPQGPGLLRSLVAAEQSAGIRRLADRGLDRGAPADPGATLRRVCLRDERLAVRPAI